MTSPLQLFPRKKRENAPVSMLALYDAPSAQIAAQSGIDALLVGDSMGNAMLGFDSTIPVTVQDIARHTQAVVRGVQKSGRSDVAIVADLPMEAMASEQKAIESAIWFLQLGAHAVKLEGVHPQLVRSLSRLGVPVMGHLGFTPQSQMRFAGVVQGKTAQHGRQLLADALELEEAGAFSVVLEAVTREVAQKITDSSKHMTTIGIGAGEGCDGQVLVFNDLIGLSPKLFKFARSYADTASIWRGAVESYVTEVSQRDFPAISNGWSMSEDEFEKLEADMEA
jgi:3-methyl-2-oxobutanoate hydroxymethyltransferase